MRRAGKTTLLHQLRRDRLEAGQERERLPFLNFEDEQLAGLDASLLHVLVDEFTAAFRSTATRRPSPSASTRSRPCPAGNVSCAACSTKRRWRWWSPAPRPRCSAGKSPPPCAARAWEVPLYPFSFEEALRHQGFPVPEPGVARLGRTLHPGTRLPRLFGRWRFSRGAGLGQGQPPPIARQLRRRRHPARRGRAAQGRQRHRPALDGPPPAGQRGQPVQRGKVLRRAAFPEHRHLEGHHPPAAGPSRRLFPGAHRFDRNRLRAQTAWSIRARPTRSTAA